MLEARLNAAGIAQAPAAFGAPTPQAPQAPIPPPLVIPPILAPPTVNPAAGTSSFRKLFPHVEAAVIMSVINHEFKPLDLYKLNFRLKEKANEKLLAVSAAGANLAIAEDERSSSKHYKTLQSVIIPLQTYARILGLHHTASGNAHVIWSAFTIYTAHLLRLTEDYEWHAVLQYHYDFHVCRLGEMAEGDYSQWAHMDLELMGEHVYPYRRAHAPTPASKKSGDSSGSDKRAKELCRNFNAGRCTADPCRHTHRCSVPGCGRAHAAKDHDAALASSA